MSQMNLQISPDQVIWPRIVLTLGTGMIIAPLSVAAYKYIPPRLRGAAVGLASLLRNEGGSVGTSTAQIIQERREQFHNLRLNEWLNPFNPIVQSFLERAEAYFFRATGDPAKAHELAAQALDNQLHQQAASLAYFDVFFLLGVLPAVLVLLVFFMKPSAAAKGEHVGGE
jgi:DHA2 family multidrug resistance protein